MHVLLVTPWYKPNVGGVVSSVSTLARTLVHHGNRCSILVLNDDEVTPRHIDDDPPDVDVWAYRLRPIYYHRNTLLVFFAWLIYFLPTVLSLRRFIKREHIDLVEVHYPGSWSLYFAALRWLFGLRYTVYVHGSDVMSNPREHFLAYLGTGMTIRSADALVACSHRLLSDTRRIFHFLPRLSRARYTGISADWGHYDHALSPESFGLTSDAYLLCNAFPIEVKGVDVLLHAFARIAARYPHVDLVLLGDRPSDISLTKLITQCNLEDRVKLIGAIPHHEVPAIIEGALFGVIPSRREGFPRVVLEYQLMGKAIVASNVGGLPEAIIDGFNGFLVPPEDPVALAERLDFCLRYPELVAQLGKNGYAQVLQQYTDRVGGSEAVNLYEAVVAAR